MVAERVDDRDGSLAPFGRLKSRLHVAVIFDAQLVVKCGHVLHDDTKMLPRAAIAVMFAQMQYRSVTRDLCTTVASVRNDAPNQPRTRGSRLNSRAFPMAKIRKGNSDLADIVRAHSSRSRFSSVRSDCFGCDRPLISPFFIGFLANRSPFGQTTPRQTALTAFFERKYWRAPSTRTDGSCFSPDPDTELSESQTSL